MSAVDLCCWDDMGDGIPSHSFCSQIARAERSATAGLETRSEPGNGSAQGFLHLPKGCLILVALSGPKEAFETILAMTGHEVDMHMGDALTDAVVDGDKRSISLQALLDGPFQQLRVLEQGPNQGSKKIGEVA